MSVTHTENFVSSVFGSAAQAWSRSDYIFTCSACCQGSNTESVLTCDLVICEYVITIVWFTAQRNNQELGSQDYKTLTEIESQEVLLE